MDLVVTFQITPYSDDTAAYINSLSSQQIYSLFSATNTAETLTAALLAITKLSNTHIDKELFSQNLNDMTLYPTAFVVVRNGKYFHHIYAWTMFNKEMSVTNIIGELSNVSFLINAVETRLDNTSPVQILRVLQPSDQTIFVLKRIGFISAKTVRNEESLRWLFDNISIGDTPLANNLLFREHDYVIQTK